MTRPWIIWLTAAFCGLIVLGAVGMMTHLTLNLEKKIYVEDEKAERVEKSIVAMEAYVDALFAREDSRNAEDFSPLQTRFNKDGSKGVVGIENGLSPLFNDTPDYANLYWYSEVGNRSPTDQLLSPQLPSWNDIEIYAPNDRARGNLENNTLQHEKLRSIMTKSSDWSIQQASDEKAKDFGNSNLGQVTYLASCTAVEESQDIERDMTSINSELAEAVSNEKSTWSTIQSKQETNNQAILEKQHRHINRTNNYINDARRNKMKDDYAVGNSFKKVPSVGYPIVNSSINSQQKIENPYLGRFADAEISPFVALWVEHELMLVRNVSTDSGKFVQGVWLDKEKIEKELIDVVVAFLPNAALEMVNSELDIRSLSYNLNDLYGLARLPYRIVPGEIPIELSGITPMRLNVIIAWTCVILAVLAVSMMFRGVMKLSERRASFVSSVSHELRTPLTTFKLYSEMLADGMIRDANKKQDYLETLSKEADRLTHMVENVLSFSKIEHGKCRRESSQVKVGDVIRQIESSLRIRLDEVGMGFKNELSSELLDVLIKVDPTSVDQILTNLFDNAAKYGQNEDGSSIVRLSGEYFGNWICLRVSDDGKGINSADSKRLFRAFHKSDIEAAHSKPGIGLGLALCRELAKSMGGDLRIIKAPLESKGACFELKLPMS